MRSKGAFSGFVKLVRKCKVADCPLNQFISKANEPIQLPHSNVENVRLIIVTEQPKGQTTNRRFLFGNISHGTVKNLQAILGERFIKSVQDRSGPYYWTHHTKCPNAAKRPQTICGESYFRKELTYFKNVNLIITFGAMPYSNICKYFNAARKGDSLPKNYLEYFYELLQENITRTKMVKSILIGNRRVPFLALPHPSGSNPLRFFLPKMKVMIENRVRLAIQ